MGKKISRAANSNPENQEEEKEEFTVSSAGCIVWNIVRNATKEKSRQVQISYGIAMILLPFLNKLH